MSDCKHPRGWDFKIGAGYCHTGKHPAEEAPWTGWICGNNYRQRGYISADKGTAEKEPWYVAEDGMHWSAYDVCFTLFADYEAALEDNRQRALDKLARQPYPFDLYFDVEDKLALSDLQLKMYSLLGFKSEGTGEWVNERGENYLQLELLEYYPISHNTASHCRKALTSIERNQFIFLLAHYAKTEVRTDSSIAMFNMLEAAPRIQIAACLAAHQLIR